MSPTSCLLALLALPNALAATIILQNQCHAETWLHTVNLECHKSSTESLSVDVAHPIISSPQPSLFDLPWPWTHPPSCTPPLPSIPTGLCVYVNGNFADGRGIAIVTTPGLGRHVASLPAFRSQEKMREGKVNVHSGLWRTEEMEEKGIGSLASQDLEPDTQILTYTPAFVAYLEHSLPTLERETIWRTALLQLPQETRDSFLALSYVHQDERVRVQAIVQANTFQLNIDGVNHLAIFPETSRLNHDCAPNAQYVIDPEWLSHTVRTTRRVGEGEELGIAYTSPMEKAEVRQEKMREGFGFVCQCARCVDSSRSDLVLDTIHSLEAHLNDWTPSSPASPAMADQLIELYEQEGLQGFLDVPYGHRALAANAVGDLERARMWAERARREVVGKDGKEAVAVGVWEGVVGDAGGHWSFGQRVGRG